MSVGETDVLESRNEPAERRLRLKFYLSALAVAMLIHLVIFGGRLAPSVLLIAAFILSALVYGAVTSASAENGLGVRVACLAAALFCFAEPMGADWIAGRGSLPALAAVGPIWSQIAAALFASRALAEDNAARYARFWREPASTRGGVQEQSLPSAFALALALLLMFYAFAPLRAGADPAWRAIAAALSGDTAIHVAILFVLFFILALEMDAAWRVARDRHALTRFAKAHDGQAIRDHDLVDLCDSPSLRWAASDLRLLAPGRPESLSYARIRGSARVYLRSLIALVPLLGFVGTIVGLSNSLSDLPSVLSGSGSPADVSGALGGLALKFQTSLLGLLASLIGGAALALIEKAESELQGQAILVLGGRRERR
jgi:hypothetical protein